MTATNRYPNPHAQVSIDWIAEHLDDPPVRLLEVDADTGGLTYHGCASTIAGGS